MSEWKPRRRPKHAAAIAKAEVKNKAVMERCRRFNDITLYFLLILVVVLRFLCSRFPYKAEGLIVAAMLLVLPVSVLQGYIAFAYIKLPKAYREPLRRPKFRTPVTDFITCVLFEAVLCHSLMFSL